MEIEGLEKELLEIAVETYRFNGVFERIIEKLDFEDQLKYKSQYNWFYKRVQRALSNAGFQFPQLQGQKYDPGMPVIPINLDDFEENEELVLVPGGINRIRLN